MQPVAADPLVRNELETPLAPTGIEQTLGRDEFMRLLVAKLENQDPLDPATDTEFVAELATFSSLEQLIQVNDNLELLSLSQDELLNSQALGLIGKDALVASDDSIRIKNGVPDTLVYALPNQARDASLSVIDRDGSVVRTIDLDRNSRGRVTLEWDGTGEDNETHLPDGEYNIRLNVTDTEGKPMAIALFHALPIEGVSFFEDRISLVSGDREVAFENIIEIREGR